MVTLARLDRPAAARLVGQGQRVAELGEQAQLEAAQDDRLGARDRLIRERAQGFLVMREQRRMRIFAREQLQQQLVEVEAAQQRRTGRQRKAAAPFGLDERLELAGACP